jgi:hypothetical protein
LSQHLADGLDLAKVIPVMVDGTLQKVADHAAGRSAFAHHELLQLG